MSELRRFDLIRREDVSGTSGTGIVAEGVEFSDGAVMIHWFNDDIDTTGDGYSFKPAPDGVEDTELVHGHDGRTEVVFRD